MAEQVDKSKILQSEDSSIYYHNSIYTNIKKELITMRFYFESNQTESGSEKPIKNHKAELHIKPDMLEGLICNLINIASKYNNAYGTDLLKLNEILKKAQNKNSEGSD